MGIVSIYTKEVDEINGKSESFVSFQGTYLEMVDLVVKKKVAYPHRIVYGDIRYESRKEQEKFSNQN